MTNVYWWKLYTWPMSIGGNFTRGQCLLVETLHVTNDYWWNLHTWPVTIGGNFTRGQYTYWWKHKETPNKGVLLHVIIIVISNQSERRNNGESSVLYLVGSLFITVTMVTYCHKNITVLVVYCLR